MQTLRPQPGWLRRLMEAAPHRRRSFGALARALLAAPSWSGERKPQERSLAALLSKFDRGLEIEWLADRPEVQVALAEVLRTSQRTIESFVGASVARADEERARMRWYDLPYAAPFDLRNEALPPGLPDVAKPADWAPLWWIAPSGSGRSLAGASLEARGMASFVSARDWEEAELRVAERGPTFVELWASQPASRSVAPRPGLCVAAPYAPSMDVAAAFRVVESPPLESFVAELVDFVALRLPRDGRLERKPAAEWLRRAAGDGIVETLGEAIGILGLIDREGLDEFVRIGLDELVERAIRDCFSHAFEGSGPSPVRDAGNALVRVLSERLLVDSKARWDSPRSLDEWSRLAGEQRGVFVLRRGGLLRRHGSADAFSLSPPWLSRAARVNGEAAIVEGSAATWGAALAAAGSKTSVPRALFEGVLQGDIDLFDDVLELRDGRTPPALAALDFAFRVAGLSLLLDVDVPVSISAALWDHAIAHSITRAGVPHPMLEYPGEAAAVEPLLAVGTWHLAALAIAETLPSGRGKAHPVLSLGVDPALPAFGEVLDSIGRVVVRLLGERDGWAREAFALAERWLKRDQASRPVARGATPILGWPLALVDALGTADSAPRVAPAETARRLLDAPASPIAVERLFELAGSRGIDERALATAAWEAWLVEPDSIRHASLLAPDAPFAERLWRHVPPSALVAIATKRFAEPSAIPYEVLGEEHWLALAAPPCAALRGVSAAWKSAPIHFALECARAGHLDATDLAVLWDRSSDALLGALPTWFVRPNDAVLRVFDAAPASLTVRVVERLSPTLRRSARTHKIVAAWLHDRVRERGPGWEAVLGVLVDAAR